MKRKITIEVDHNLVENEILQYRDGLVRSVEIHELLPDLTEAKRIIEEQGRFIAELQKTVVELAKIVKEK